jgi:hypothetical protein
MQKHIFEYAVIRLVPKVEREEFLNIGVIMFCAKLKFIEVKFTANMARIHAFSAVTDLDELQQHMAAFSKIARGGKDAGPIGKLDAASRFRWLTATRSTILQPSKIHPGYCTDDASCTIDRLFEQMVE